MKTFNSAFVNNMAKCSCYIHWMRIFLIWSILRICHSSDSLYIILTKTPSDVAALIAYSFLLGHSMWLINVLLYSTLHVSILFIKKKTIIQKRLIEIKIHFLIFETLTHPLHNNFL